MGVVRRTVHGDRTEQIISCLPAVQYMLEGWDYTKTTRPSPECLLQLGAFRAPIGEVPRHLRYLSLTTGLFAGAAVLQSGPQRRGG